MARRPWFGNYFGPWILRVLGVELPERPTVELIAGAGVTIGAVDDPDTAATKVTISSSGGGGVATTNGDAPQAAAEVETSDATATAIGDAVSLATDSVTTIDVAVQCIQAGATKAKVFSVRRSFLNDGGSVTDGTQQDLITAEELGGTLAASVDITRTGTTAQPKVTGVAGIGFRWYLISQAMAVTSAAAEAAPTVSSITPDTGSTAGGDAVTIAGTGFVDGATVTIGGAAATSVVWVSATSITCDTPAGSAGAQDVVVTNPDAQTGTLAGGYTYAAAFDPSSLVLTDWQRGSYSSSPWAGTASAGTSATPTLTGTVGVGSAVNGYTPADLNGSSHVLTCSATIDTLVGAGTGFIACLFHADTAAAPAGGGATDDRPLVTDANSRVCLVHTTSGIKAAIYNGTAWVETASIACPTGAWHWAFCWWTGTTLYVQLDGGSPVSVSIGGSGGTVGTGTMRVGQNYATTRFDGKVMEVMLAATEQSASIADIVTYGNSRYGLAL